jgi:hypothetical protein
MDIELILGIIGLLSTILFLVACAWLALTQKPLSIGKRSGTNGNTDYLRTTTAEKNHRDIATLLEGRLHQPERQ